ncbi:hypothetical protein GP486_002320 [Trichoglossum hirsutum]|uniref:C2H2-type domain-containing protein n=1 Tax=Trichoglossum hirsutum TaxID=265104 RepID=A0A9P8LFB4_9PEZI|nr:hypothetical protein GP486_002320 [Trichoglossum hirsutum]
METEDTTNGGNWAIFSATGLSRHSFKRCLSIPSLMWDGWAENRLMDFNLWASGVGASAKPPAGLDQRLESRSDVRAVVLGLLSTLTTLIDLCAQLGSSSGGIEQFQGTLSPEDIKHDPVHDESSTDRSDPFASWSDESSVSAGTNTEQQQPNSSISPIEQSKLDVESILDQIIRLGILIRSSGNASRLRRADAYFSFGNFENLDNKDYKHSLKVPTKDLLELRAHLLAYLFIHPSQYGSKLTRGDQFNFKSNLSELEPSHREVLEHLTFANLRRRNRFWYAQKHAGKLAAAQTILFPEQPKASIMEQDLPNKQLRLPSNEDFRPAAVPEAGTLSTITGTAASEGKIELQKLGQMAHHQHAMSRASVSLKKSGWPHPPKMSEQRKTFRCPCCYLTLSSLEAERWHWRKHLSADICPYTCLFPDCSIESPLFVTRDEWKTHLRLDHQSSDYWECFACTDADNAIVFSTPDEFLAHIKQHKDVVSDVDTSRLLDICVRSDPISVKMCPLCVSVPQRKDMDPDTLLDHIGDHMHDFALQSLPWMDTSENTCPKYLTDETVQKIAKWFNEIVPNVESAEEHYPAYPSEETVMRAITFSVDLPELRPCDFDVSGELGSNIDPNRGDYFAESQGATSQAQPDFEIALRDYQTMSSSGAGSSTINREADQHGQPGVSVQQSRAIEGDRIVRDADDGDEKRVLREEHPDTLSSINNLGSVLESQGKYEEAEAMYRRALEGYEKVLGPEHPSTLSNINNLGSVLREDLSKVATFEGSKIFRFQSKSVAAAGIKTNDMSAQA